MIGFVDFRVQSVNAANGISNEFSQTVAEYLSHFQLADIVQQLPGSHVTPVLLPVQLRKQVETSNHFCDAERHGAGELAVQNQEVRDVPRAVITAVDMMILTDSRRGMKDLSPLVVVSAATYDVGLWQQQIRFNIQQPQRHVCAFDIAS